jgi:uncharacterized protein (TIGR03435 family)
MLLRRTLLLAAAILAIPTAFSQRPACVASPNASTLPSFEAATIKPSDPARDTILGFVTGPGGRVYLSNAKMKMLLYYAFNIPEAQISGGPGWIDTDRYTIAAVPPDSAISRTTYMPINKASPSAEQREMLQHLLYDRFTLKCHIETREGPVYILTRGTGKLLLEAPKDPKADARAAVANKGGIYDGEAFGQNISMPILAGLLAAYLQLPVIDQTGINGTYDFHLQPDDPTNTDYLLATIDAMRRLGLNLKRGKGPVQTLIIDHVERPTEN